MKHAELALMKRIERQENVERISRVNDYKTSMILEKIDYDDQRAKA
jgi:hypothetical protein